MAASGSGTVALIGSGEFLAKSDALDRELLARVGGPARVVVLPTASAPDGPGIPERWARMGQEHYTRLGAASVDPVLLLTAADANDPAIAARIAAANFVYLSGGKPGFLLETLRGTASWQAVQGVVAAGGVVAGCSAGAMALAGEMFAWPQMWRTQPGLGLAPGLAVIPHFDELPGMISALLNQLPKHVTVVGVEGATGFVGAGNDWTVAGTGGVTVFQGKTKTRYTAGQPVTLALV